MFWSIFKLHNLYKEQYQCQNLAINGD